MSETPSDRTVYKICRASEWDRAVAAGVYLGSEDDARDGFIHFSLAHQLAKTAAKFFAGQTDLVLVSVDAGALGEALRDEPARSGDLFPHLYGTLDPRIVQEVVPLPWDGAAHRLPAASALVGSKSVEGG